MAIDRQKQVDTVFEGHGIPGWGVPYIYYQDKMPTLAQLGPWFLLPAIAYNAVLAVLAVRDAATLPTRRGWEATRDLPTPLSLGAHQEVLVGAGRP